MNEYGSGSAFSQHLARLTDAASIFVRDLFILKNSPFPSRQLIELKLSTGRFNKVAFLSISWSQPQDDHIAKREQDAENAIEGRLKWVYPIRRLLFQIIVGMRSRPGAARQVIWRRVLHPTSPLISKRGTRSLVTICLKHFLILFFYPKLCSPDK